MYPTTTDSNDALLSQALDEILSWWKANASPDVNPLDTINDLLSTFSGKDLYELFPTYMKLLNRRLHAKCLDLMFEADERKNLFDFVDMRDDIVVCKITDLTEEVYHDLRATLIKRREQH